MAGNNSIQILRGSGHSSSAQLLPGQPYYDYFNNQLYIGGPTSVPINQLKPVGSTGSGTTRYIHLLNFHAETFAPATKKSNFSISTILESTSSTQITSWNTIRNLLIASGAYSGGTIAGFCSGIYNEISGTSSFTVYNNIVYFTFSVGSYSGDNLILWYIDNTSNTASLKSTTLKVGGDSSSYPNNFNNLTVTDKVYPFIDYAA